MRLKDAIRSVRRSRDVVDNDQTLNKAVSIAFESLVLEKKYENLKELIPDVGDLDIPTRLAFAMHFHLLTFQEATIEDRKRFSTFLNLYYEEWDDWASAIRESS